MPTGATRKNGVERRDALLDAALGCFAKQGILETGIEDVRKAAGASPSSVYHLFEGGMNDIVFALLERTVARFHGLLSDAALEENTGEDVVHAIVRAHLDWVVTSRDEARFMYQALALELAGTRRREIARMKADLKKQMFEHLDVLVGGGLSKLPPFALELLILGPTHHACRGYLANGSADLEWVRQELSTHAWGWVASKAKPTKAKRGRLPP